MPIEWPDIDAFVRNTRSSLDPFDIEMIEELDDCYLAAQLKELSDADKQQAMKDGLKSAEKPR